MFLWDGGSASDCLLWHISPVPPYSSGSLGLTHRIPCDCGEGQRKPYREEGETERGWGAVTSQLNPSENFFGCKGQKSGVQCQQSSLLSMSVPALNLVSSSRKSKQLGLPVLWWGSNGRICTKVPLKHKIREHCTNVRIISACLFHCRCQAESLASRPYHNILKTGMVQGRNRKQVTFALF